MTTPAPLVTVAWWRILLERLGRQAAQTAVPILAAVVGATGHVDVRATLFALLGAEAVTLLTVAFRYLADVHPDRTAPFLVQVLDRAVPAAAGVLAGLPLASWVDVLTVDWAEAGYAALAAAVTAILAVYITPPALTPPRTGPADRAPSDAYPYGQDSGFSRTAAVLVLAGCALAIAIVPAAAHRPDPPLRRSPVLAVPVIQYSAVGCETNAVLLTVQPIRETGGNEWDVAADPLSDATRVQAWYSGTWHDVPSRVTSSGLVVQRGDRRSISGGAPARAVVGTTSYPYRTRVLISDGRNTVAGPPWTTSGACASWVDDVVRGAA